MSNDKRNEFHGELLPPEVIRKGVYELGNVERVPPSVGIFDSPTRCFVVNVEWWSHIAGMVHLLADVVSWKDATDESYFAITEILKFMQGMECMDFALRQNPADDCILQQTLDGGETWTDVFDFSQCVTIQDKSYQISIANQVTNVQQTFTDIYNNFTTNYAGLPSDVYPDLADPGPGVDDSALKAALCNAIWELIRTACNAAVSYYTETVNQTQGELNFLIAVAGFVFTALALAAAIPSAGASLVALGGAATLIGASVGLSAATANLLVDYWQQHTIDQFQDTEAMEEVACYLVDELAAGDVSLAEVQAALVGHGLTGNAGVIADFLAILLSHDSTYAAFLEKWNNNKQYADAGIDLYCPCATEYRVWSWSFTNGLGPFEIVDFGGTQYGTLESGRIRGVDLGVLRQVQLFWNNFNPTWRIHQCKLYYERIGGTNHASRDIEQVTWRPTPNSNTGANFFPSASGVDNGVLERCSVFGPYGTNYQQVLFNVAVNDPLNTSEIYLDRVEILFAADYAKGGYITDDTDLCS
jgi:hypothetical protein